MPNALTVMRDAVSCWLDYRLSRTTARSQLGGKMRVPLEGAETHWKRENRLIWYIDMERRLARLSNYDRQVVILSGLGHTQECLAHHLGCSLRSMVRYQSEAVARLMALRDDRPRLPSDPLDPIDGMVEPVGCECRIRRPGRRLKKQGNLPKCAESRQ